MKEKAEAEETHRTHIDWTAVIAIVECSEKSVTLLLTSGHSLSVKTFGGRP